MNAMNLIEVDETMAYASRYRQYINYIELTELNEMNWFNCWVCCKRYEVTERNLMKFDWSERNEWKCSSNVIIFIHDFVSRIQFHFSECSENEWMKDRERIHSTPFISINWMNCVVELDWYYNSIVKNKLYYNGDM